MIEFEIKPLVGVGPVLLGSSRAQVRAVLGEPSSPSRENREMYFDGFFVDYDKAGNVELIELARSECYRATFHGTALHEVPAEQAISIVCAYDSYDQNDSELGYSYVFLSLQLSLWRGTVSETDQPANDTDGRYFEAIGVAVSGYFVQS